MLSPTAASQRSSIPVTKQRVLGGEKQLPEEDFLAIEDPLEITLAYERHAGIVEKKLMVTMRTPGNDTELIHGFLFCEGLIKSASDIIDIDFTGAKVTAAPTAARVLFRKGLDASVKSFNRDFAVHSSCGVCGTSSMADLEISPSLRLQDTTRVSAELIHKLPDRMHTSQATFRKTGGLHAAAIFHHTGELQVSHEDIGRHNALDKAIGANLLSELCPGESQVLCVSGRMSYEILQKALIARIPIIAGVGAPSSLAVSLANDFNITLIGFVRNGSYNIYSRSERIT